MTTVPDWLAALGVLVPALSGLVGYWFAGRNEEARDRRATEREREARRTDLAERLDERMHTFQLDLLLELQNVLQRQARATSRIILHDFVTLRDRGQWEQMPEDVSQESYDIGVELGRLRVRVLDDSMREELDQFHWFVAGLEAAFVLLQGRPKKEALEGLETNRQDLVARYRTLNDHLGTLLRAELGRSPAAPPGQKAVTGASAVALPTGTDPGVGSDAGDPPQA
jgi:hypothetical protein